jgi:hypothetical protein
MPTKSELLNQLHSLQHKGFAVKLAERAAAHNFPAAYFYAIASRETNCINELGDFQGGEFHGVGIIQIDIQHTLARHARSDGSWRTNPDPLLDFGAQMLEDNINSAKQAFPGFTTQQHLKIAASGYNCGIGRAIVGSQHGDSDRATTGHNYGRDVMTRMAIFEELLEEGN